MLRVSGYSSRPMNRHLCILASLLLLSGPVNARTYPSELHRVGAEIVSQGLEHPWGLAFLPDGGFLVTERPGRLRLISPKGELHPQPIAGLPPVRQYGQGGLLDIALHPQFETNRWLYFSYAERDERGIGTAVGRGRLQGHRLHDVELIFRLQPKTGKPYHFGSRLVFDKQGHLFITLGDRGTRSRAQDLDDHAGSLIRLQDDGSIPADNPFIARKSVRPEIYSYGHRNMQGAALHPQSGKLWTHEHGPQGGDELNIPASGVNFGWPVITYGKNYGTGTDIGEGTHKAGMAQPVHHWVPSIAPSGMAFYTADAFPRWRGNLFIGSLKFQQLVRLQLEGEKVVHEERLFSREFGRIRDVRQGPDGLLYLLTDADDGRLIRLRPAPAP